MTDNIVDLKARQKIKALDSNIKELSAVTKILNNTIKDLTKYDHYSTVRRRVDDLFVLYQDIKQARDKKLEILERLKNEQKTMD